jgi:hypothetical protein
LSRNAYLYSMSSRQPTRRKSEPEDVAWVVTRLTGTPAKYVARVHAPDATTAIASAIEEAGITNPQLQQKLVARRE